MTLLIDIHEPREATRYLTGVVECEVSSLNSKGYADYAWLGVEGMVQVERKQWGEVLTSIESVEDQLRRHLHSKPECRLVFLLEGLATGSSTGTTILRSTSKSNIFVAGRESSIRLSQVYAWLYQLSKFCEVYQTSGYYETCLALVAMYKGDQKKEHTTFKRAYKKVEYHANPRVTQLMGVLPGIGEARAEALIAKFITVWNVMNASPQELSTVPGIGAKLSVDILRRIGRPDV